MALQKFSAPSRPRSGIQRTVPPSGVTHIRYRHTERFTVVGNHLAQHPDLSLASKGLGLLIQSLPDGVKIGIKALMERCGEGEVAIASALRELEAYGYLSRQKERTAAGCWVTRTVAYDNPQARRTAAQPEPQPEPEPEQAPERAPGAVRSRTAPVPGPVPAPTTAQLSAPTSSTAQVSAPVPPPFPVPPPPPVPAPAASSPPSLPLPPPPLPEPDHPDLTRHRTAAELLSGLRRHDPRLLLSTRDVARLTPAVSAWLERGVEPAAVQRTLTALLPQVPIHRPAALLAHRLTALLPPPLPAVPDAPPAPPPLQNCDNCDHAFRSPHPGRCRPCRASPPTDSPTLDGPPLDSAPLDSPLRATG
jgi:hypothetical protein